MKDRRSQKRRRTLWLTGLAAMVVAAVLTAVLTHNQAGAFPGSLVSWWPAEGNATDVQDGNSGSLLGDATFAPGQVGQAFSFDGNGDGVAVGNAGFPTGDFSVVAWVKLAALPPGPNSGNIFQNYGGVPVAQQLLIEPATGRPAVFFRDAAGNSVNAVGPTSLNDGQWHRLIGVRSGTTGLLYVDGTLAVTNTNPLVGSISTGCGIAHIGTGHTVDSCGVSASDGFFQGLIDEVQIYSAAITPADLMGSISGQKFNDLNGNGVRDAGEPGLAGWTITLDTNQLGVLDAGDALGVTDANGNYSFINLNPGTYRVREVAQAGWSQTSADPADLVLPSGQAVAGINFGNRAITRGSISGQKFNDLNGNGAPNAGEPGLAAWTIFLDTNQNGQLDAGEASTLTDANGNYTFANLNPGTYRVREVAQAGWSQTSANPADLVVPSGQTITGVNFGNRAINTPTPTPTATATPIATSTLPPTTTATATPTPATVALPTPNIAAILAGADLRQPNVAFPAAIIGAAERGSLARAATPQTSDPAIRAPSTGTGVAISPPNTGDAGLASSQSPELVVLGSIGALAGNALLFARRRQSQR